MQAGVSELAVVGVTREGDDVPDVLNASAELHQPLKAQAKTRMWH